MSSSIPLFQYWAYSIITSITLFLQQDLLAKYITTPNKIICIKDPIKREIERREYFAYHSSIIHGFVLSLFGAYVFFVEEEKWESLSTSGQNKLIAFSLGYFFTDTINGFRFNYNNLMFFIHHILSLMIILVTLITGKFGYTVILSFGIGEISNPFMAIRSILQKHTRFEKIASVFEIMFCVVFLIARLPVVFFFSNKVFEKNLSLFLKFNLAAACELNRVFVFNLVIYGF